MKTPLEKLLGIITLKVKENAIYLMPIIDKVDVDNYRREEKIIIDSVSGSTFTNEELQTIKIDILHIYDKISLSETEVHKRKLILNKLKILLGDEYYR